MFLVVKDAETGENAIGGYPGDLVPDTSASLFGATPVGHDVEIENLTMHTGPQRYKLGLKGPEVMLFVAVDDRKAFTVDLKGADEQGLYHVNLVAENRAGFWPVPHEQFATEQEAYDWCTSRNRAVGLTEHDVECISSSSFRAQEGKRGAAFLCRQVLDVLNGLVKEADPTLVSLDDLTEGEGILDPDLVSDIRELLEGIATEMQGSTEDKEWLRECYPAIAALA